MDLTNDCCFSILSYPGVIAGNAFIPGIIKDFHLASSFLADLTSATLDYAIQTDKDFKHYT